MVDVDQVIQGGIFDPLRPVPIVSCPSDPFEISLKFL